MVSKSDTPGIYHLPIETLALVFSSLDYRALVALQKCCRQFYHIVRDAASLKYILALAAAGVCDDADARGDLTSAEMLEKLARYEEAWLSLNWTEHIIVKSGPGEQLSAPSNPLIWQSSSEGKAHLRLFRAPSRLRDVAKFEWEFPIEGYPIFSYVFDLSHDLCVVQTSDVPRPHFHFLTLSTGDCHPHARLQHTIESDHVLFGLLLTRHYLVIPSASGRQTVVDWRTGRHVTHVMCNYYSLGFLDDNHLLVLPPPQQESGPCVLVYRLHPGPVAVVLAFGLPSFTAGHSMEDCTIKCAPYEPYDLPQSPPTGHFLPDPNDQLLTIGFSEFNATPCFELIVHARAFLSYLPAVPVSHPPVFIHWDNWGISRTHISLATLPPRVGWRGFCIFGSRRVGIRARRRSCDDALVADVWDYNSRRLARAHILQQEIDADNRNWEVRYRDTVDHMWGNDGPLVTRLPHIKIEVRLPDELQNQRPEDVTLYINDNSIIACTDRVERTPSVAHVLVF